MPLRYAMEQVAVMQVGGHCDRAGEHVLACNSNGSSVLSASLPLVLICCLQRLVCPYRIIMSSFLPAKVSV